MEEKVITMADKVQIFDVDEALKKGDQLVGRTDMARSPNSFVAVFRTRPRGGETHIHQHPDSDQILFVLRSELTVEGLSEKYVLKPNQGVLIPAGVHYGFTNTTDKDLIFLSMRTESSGGRRVAYVKNVPSNVHLKIPADALAARGIGHHIYVYAMDRDTFGLSPLLFEDWNKGSLLRMNCEYEMDDGHVVAKLPERLVQWYKIDRLSDSNYKFITEPEKTRVRVELKR
ncbi:MAG TPA: cupin domain-containing protein [Candidatus Binatia bacterium]|jgi:mannose-6-phosphate isomerase-like protein (cupin superfamily)